MIHVVGIYNEIEIGISDVSIQPSAIILEIIQWRLNGTFIDVRIEGLETDITQMN